MSAKSTAEYWNRGVDAVPWVTGAATVMDCSDLRDALEQLGVTLPLPNVFDVGCGTGRLAELVSRTPHGHPRYIGCDIAADAVAYAHAQRRCAFRIQGPSDLPKTLVPMPLAYAMAWVHGAAITANTQSAELPLQWVTCLSVATHIGRRARQGYLCAFVSLAPNLVIDIIPGDGTGDVALWTARPDDFERDLASAGWAIAGTYERVSPDGPNHRYYRCARAS